MKKRHFVQNFLSGYFGVVIAAGGVIGYLKASSIPSLIMGLSFGFVFIFSGFIGKRFPKQSGLLNLYAAIALSSFFIFRYSIAWKFMPAGLMAIHSILMFIWSAYFLKKLKDFSATTS